MLTDWLGEQLRKIDACRCDESNLNHRITNCIKVYTVWNNHELYIIKDNKVLGIEKII